MDGGPEAERDEVDVGLSCLAEVPSGADLRGGLICRALAQPARTSVDGSASTTSTRTTETALPASISCSAVSSSALPSATTSAHASPQNSSSSEVIVTTSAASARHAVTTAARSTALTPSRSSSVKRQGHRGTGRSHCDALDLCPAVPCSMETRSSAFFRATTAQGPESASSQQPPA